MHSRNYAEGVSGLFEVTVLQTEIQCNAYNYFQCLVLFLLQRCHTLQKVYNF